MTGASEQRWRSVHERAVGIIYHLPFRHIQNARLVATITSCWPTIRKMSPPGLNRDVCATTTTGTDRRAMRHKIVIHAGETLEWSNSDPTASHTITFGTEPANPMPPSTNVTVDPDGARHAVINSTEDSVHSGFIVAASQERVGLPQSHAGVTRFRVTFSHVGIYPYICVLHDNLGMKGSVVVLP
jgi:plastocyanin